MTKNTHNTHLEMPSCNDLLVWDICFAAYQYPSLMVAIKIGLFSLLEQEALTTQEIAARFSFGLRGTEALLAVITSLKLLVKREEKFYLTETTRNYLLPNSPYSWIPALYMFRNIPITMEGIIEALNVSTSSDSSEKSEKEVWENFEMSPKLADRITQGMHAHSLPAALGVARSGDFNGVNRLLDVAGGSGCFSIAIATVWQKLNCTVMELPAICKLTEQYIASYHLTSRIETKAANMFIDDWPTGYDAVFFSNILHDWDMQKNNHLIKQSFKILPTNGRIYLHEALLDDGKDGPLTVAAFSMSMLLGTQGKQFTAHELTQLLIENGFEQIKITPTYGYYSLISGKKLG